MTETKLEFLPFHAINEFMRDDFRLAVIRSALGALNEFPEAYRSKINRLTGKLVKIPGFRHSDKAPAIVRTIPTAKAFEKSPDLVAAILAAWADAHADLRVQMAEVLSARGWKAFPAELTAAGDLPELKTEQDWAILPLEADRTRLPGFVPFWPQAESFENLYQTFSEKFPQAVASLDETSLMAVWLTLRLPYQYLDPDGNVISTEQTSSPADESTSDS